MNNWKTSTLGVLLIAAALINAAIDLIKNGTMPDLHQLTLAVTAGAGLIAAADSKPSLPAIPQAPEPPRATPQAGIPFTASAIALLLIGCSSVLLIPVVLFTGCSSATTKADTQKIQAIFQTDKAKVATWWALPSTQAGVQIAEQALLSSAFNFGLNLGGQELTTGKIDLASAGMSTASFEIRKLEMTPQAGNSGAIASAIFKSVQDPKQAKAIASAVLGSVATATNQGANPSGAIEGAASALDKLAATK